MMAFIGAFFSAIGYLLLLIFVVIYCIVHAVRHAGKPTPHEPAKTDCPLGIMDSILECPNCYMRDHCFPDWDD